MGTLLLLGLLLATPGDFQTIRILATADLHCRVLPSADFSAPGLPRRELGGLENLARLIKELRTGARNCDERSTLLLDCGDFAFGSPEGRATQGRAAVRFMNQCGYDAAALGASDFCGSAENVEVLAKAATFPLLADPMLDVVLNRSTPLFRPFVVKDVKGVKVAVIGLGDPEVQNLNRKDDTRGLANDEPLVQVRRYITAVRAEAPDIVVALGHIGPDQGAMLLDSFPELGLVICPSAAQAAGVSRDRLVQVGSYGQRVDVVDILFNRTDRRVYQVEVRSLNVIAGRSDSAARRLADEVMVQGLDSLASFSSVELVPEDSFGMLGTLVCEAARSGTKADLAILPWSALGSGLTEGPLTRRALFDAAPFCEPVRLALMDDTTLHKFVGGLDATEPFPMLAGADLFVIGDTAGWPAAGQVARIRHRERKSQYRVVATEQLLEHAGVPDPGKLLEKNLSDLWLDWASSQDTLEPVSGSRLYPATAGLVIRSDSASFPININTATAELLEKLPGIGPKTAERIIEYRSQHGRFGSVEELLDVKGIGPKKMEKIRPLVTVR